MKSLASYAFAPLFSLFALTAHAQTPPQTIGQRMNAYFADGNRRILEMARDFPEDKYGFRPTKEMRSFGEVIVHVTSGNVYAAKKGRGEPVKWDEIDAKKYSTKAAIVALLEKSIADCKETLKTIPEEHFAKSMEPWMGVMEHSAEHYGLLVAYYRLNGLVPPESRPKAK